MLCAGGCGAESGAVAAQSSLRPLGTRHQTSDCGFPVPSPAPPRVRVCGPSRETQRLWAARQCPWPHRAEWPRSSDDILIAW